MSNRDERESKLPVWAQDLILSLRAEAGKWREYAKTLEWDHPNTNTHLQVRDVADRRLAPLPKNAVVVFDVGDAQIAVRITSEGHLDVSEQSGKTLNITPWVTNVIRVRAS